MKIKKIFSLLAIATLSVFSVFAFSPATTGLKTVIGASVTDSAHNFDYVSQTQSLTFNVSDLSVSNGSSKKFDLYGSNAITSSFTCENNRNEKNVGKSKVLNNQSLTYTTLKDWKWQTITYFTAGINELAYYSEDSSGSDNRDMKVYSSISLSPSIVIAMSNGFVDVSAESYFASFSHDQFNRIAWREDLDEYVKMELVAYNSTTSTIKGQVSAGSLDSNPRGNYLSTKDKLSLSGDAITGNDSNMIELVFTTKLNTGGYKDSDAANFLRIKEPSVAFSTSDNLVPVVSCDYDKFGYALVSENNYASASWAKSREFKFNVSDLFDTTHGSGIQKVEYKVGNGAWQSLVDNTTELTYEEERECSYEITENGVYTFRAYDNVGNISNTITYTETHIDSNSPNATISMNDNELHLDRTFTIPVVIDTTTLGPSIDTFEYSINGGERIAFDGNIEIVDIANGTYNFAFYGYDEAGNMFEKLVEGVIVDDTIYKITTRAANGTITESFETKRASKSVAFSPKDDNSYFYKFVVNGTIVDEEVLVGGTYSFDVYQDLTIEVVYREKITLAFEEENVYNPNGYTPVYTENIAGNYDVSLRYFSADKQHEFASIDEVGSYVVVYEIDDELFFGSGEQEIEIIQKEIKITNIKTTGYVYTGSKLSVVYTHDAPFALVETFKKNGDVSEFVDAGTYAVEITVDDRNYKVVSKLQDSDDFVDGCTFDAVIDKHTIVVSNVVSEYVYDNEPHFVTFDANVSDAVKSLISVSYIQNNNSVESPVNAGSYKAVFAFNGNENNYVFDFSTNEETAVNFVISARAITVTAVSQQITYGDVVEEFKFTVSNGVASEPLAFEVVCDDLSTDVGSYELSFKQERELSISEAETFANYQISYVHGFVVIDKKDLVIYPAQKQYKIYGDAEKVITYTHSGLVYDDLLEGELSRVEGEDVGYYEITIGTLQNKNYNITVSATEFEIIKRVCFIVVLSNQKVYGEADPVFAFSKTGTNILDKDLQMFDKAEYFSRKQGEDVGKYEISYNSDLLNSLDEFANYMVVDVSGNLKITQKPLVISANNVETCYGEEKELSAEVVGLLEGDEIEVVLERELGDDVGTYAISLVKASHKNYKVQSFNGANYVISPKKLEITAVSTEKTYGEEDSLTFEIKGNLETIEVVLSRELGEDVGEYQINKAEISNGNYVIDKFVPGTLTINKKALYVVLDNKVKTYGEDDEEFTYSISGLAFDDLLTLSVVREAGENAGEYVISLGENNLKNYVISGTPTAVYTICKANLEVKLDDVVAVYSGNPVFAKEPEFPFELVYEYKSVGMVIEKPVNAGTYQVVAKFAGNENYNACSSNVANIVINKKMVPVVLTKSTLVYNGTRQAPEFEIGLNYKVSLLISYENNLEPIEVGEYNFTISSNDANHYCDFAGKLKIVDEFNYSNGNSASVSSSSVSFSGEGINIFNNKNSALLGMFNPLFDGRQCVAVYEFMNGDNASGEVFMVRVKALSLDENVEIFSVDDDGNMVKTAYVVEDGYYVIAVNDLASKIMVTKTNNMLVYAKIVAVTTVMASSIFIVKILNARRLKKFLVRNTKVKTFDKEILKTKAGIVSEKFCVEQKVSASDFIE